MGKKNTLYSEIEFKYDAQHVTHNQFNLWATSLKPFSCKRVQGWDSYYRNKSHVVRHRYNDNYNALTVKLRKSSNSITDRVEVDLMIQGSPDDAVQFLTRTGYTKEFSLWKKAHIYHVDDNGVEITLVIYDTKTKGKPDGRFIEVEVEKCLNVSPRLAKKVLKKWDLILRERFGLTKPMNKSLYEIISGKAYKKVAA